MEDCKLETKGLADLFCNFLGLSWICLSFLDILDFADVLGVLGICKLSWTSKIYWMFLDFSDVLVTELLLVACRLL